MNPWTIIGWVIIGLVSFRFFLWVSVTMFLWILRRVMYWKTRNLAPVEGQIWVQGMHHLYIGRLHEAGHFTISTYHPKDTIRNGSSWGERLDDWKERVRSRKLYLYGHWE
jgi:hypothetical protein